MLSFIEPRLTPESVLAQHAVAYPNKIEESAQIAALGFKPAKLIEYRFALSSILSNAAAEERYWLNMR
jgi:hypothetical protein